jgi:hypothetical protein
MHPLFEASVKGHHFIGTHGDPLVNCRKIDNKASRITLPWDTHGHPATPSICITDENATIPEVP